MHAYAWYVNLHVRIYMHAMNASICACMHACMACIMPYHMCTSTPPPTHPGGVAIHLGGALRRYILWAPLHPPYILQGGGKSNTITTPHPGWGAGGGPLSPKKHIHMYICMFILYMDTWKSLSITLSSNYVYLYLVGKGSKYLLLNILPIIYFLLYTLTIDRLLIAYALRPTDY